MTGRRRGETPLLDPTRPQAASHPPRGCAPRPPCGLTPRTNGAPSALRLREARRKRLAKGRKFESLRGGKAPSHSPTRPRQLDDLHNPQAPQQLHRRRFYAKEGGRPGWPVERERPSSVKECISSSEMAMRAPGGHQVGIERGPVLPFRFALVVALELAGAFNLPHADRPSDR